MLLATIDEIVRRGLLENSLPIHWYSELLYHSATCIRELNYETLQIINTANLPVNDYGGVDLPDDFDDDVSVCVPAGMGLLPLPHQDWITPLRIHSTETGEFVPYPNLQNTSGLPNVFYGFPYQWSFYWNVNDYGEAMGRRFGSHGGTAVGYRVVKERRQLQMTGNFNDTNIILMYISTGQSIDNASQIDYKAFQTIRAYQDWQKSPNKGNDNSSEGKKYYNQLRHLKSRLNPLTKTDIQNIIRSAYSAGIKF